jgi:hypothetical protein
VPYLTNLMQATLNIGEDDSTNNQSNGSSNKPASVGPSLGVRLIKSIDGKPFQHLRFSPQLPQDCPTQVPQLRVLPTSSASTENPFSPKWRHTVVHSDYTVENSNPQKSVQKRGSRARRLATTSTERARAMQGIGACWPCRFSKIKVSW